MKQNEFTTLDDEKLIWMFAEPIIRNARGRDPSTKAQVFEHLKDGQRALFMFQVLYGHAGNGIFQFFRQISYLTDSLDFWSALQSAMKYFNDFEMLKLVERMEAAYLSLQHQNMTSTELNEIDKIYSETIPKTLTRIGECIRNNPSEFSDEQF